MALKTQFPLFAPPQVFPQPHRPATEIRFSRWNNANAQKFVRRERSQKELEDQLRLEKRFDSAQTIAHNYNPAPPHLTTFKSTGTPSAPSSPSIPGKASKYSKDPSSHPAFKPLAKPRNIRIKGKEVLPQKPDFRIDENGISYEMPAAPFLYQYSYTETPKVKPVKLREPLVSPFGPETMSKPWLGRKPLPPSKKKLPEFDSFKLPPPHKKGVKPIQAPGPYLPGSGPKYVISREEVLGEPLTKEEAEALIEGSRKSSRQLNMGRDGLTHNMLDNIHALWKRRRVCKIKCKGVCTVDMDNVCQQLEEKTGGKIIYNKGGVIYLFRGRNYNHRSRPRFPLMLWKPATPVYPRLVQRVPDGLTLEEASDMRKKGRDLTSICKLAKNGVYCDLVENVREAFEACELVRIDCQGLNPSDYRKIAAKLKDLVPCVLVSFEREHILIWRGPHWKSSIEPTMSLKRLEEVKTDGASGLSAAPSTITLNSCINEEKHYGLDKTISPTYSNEKSQGDSVVTNAGAEDTMAFVPDISVVASHQVPADNNIDKSVTSLAIPGSVDDSVVTKAGAEDTMASVPDISVVASHQVPADNNIDKCVTSLAIPGSVDDRSEAEECNQTAASEIELDSSVESQNARENTDSIAAVLESTSSVDLRTYEQLNSTQSSNEQMSLNVSCTEEIMLLRKQALDNGMAVMLDRGSLDADIVFKKAVAFAKTARMGPRFPLRSKQLGVDKKQQQEGDDSGVKEAPVGTASEITTTVRSSRRDERKTSRTSKKMEDIKADYLNVVPQGNLRVDELAKLLS